MDITPTQLKKRLDAGEPVVLIDVRESLELDICQLPGAVHIPMGQLPTRWRELDNFKERDLIIFCRSGHRSHNCCRFLQQQGLKRVINLAGGILAWSDEVDSTVAKY